MTNTAAKKALGFWLAILAVIIARLVGGVIFPEKSVEEQVSKMTIDANKKLPLKVDEITKLVSTGSLGKDVYSKYEVDVSLKDVDKSELDKYRMEKEALAIKTQCSNSKFVDLMKKGVAFYYIWVDKDGVPIMDIKVSRESCGN